MSRWFSLILYLGCLLALVQAATGAADAEAPAASEPAAEGGIKNTVTRIIKAYINGGVIPVDYEERAKKDEADGVVRITDANSEELLASPGDDVWVIVVHGRDADFLATAFTEAHANVTKRFAKDAAAAEGDAKAEIEHFKFGRLDYYNDWATCTRWLITKPPYLVFVSENNGKKELRFLSFPPFPAEGEKMYKLIKDGHWKNIRPWKSPYNPVDGERGGNRNPQHPAQRRAAAGAGRPAPAAAPK
ncbi:hypothetical protein A1Q1_07112 [Trichosporon asahii var. asahii CBS 2479]|uniref:Thioredoxin domain-containing protein n=1 Tax=Trichosporon asahii var. asahii (strain ATCC 90039 / CBS 2479 / JCM 2466 / KCTC 7840 / NBRC 103889/ NCYC 2677 / UAMH 7654) TaxID=1186058 RepID=J4UIZ5_TRIAS|nr:hypothetical protein A1Q1_07112 [Trichosporon asahii var. asahii CBS 2479]EJT51700.1 hypothetical protein A1Q1_07112 [Trichosporon asahii var. asahii CBS 2479]